MSNKEKLYQSFANALAIEKSAINDNLSYQSIKQWDSISHMMLISVIEEDFDVSLDTEDVIDLSSVGKAMEILKKYNVTFE
jgi:acyl carrier protein